MIAIAAGVRHRWPIWHAALHAICVVIGRLPRSYRFRTAVFLARLLLPVIRTTPMFRARRRSVAEAPLEIALYSILNELARSGIEFDPATRVMGMELLDVAIQSAKGVLLLSTRTMLGQAFVRYLADRHYSISLVAPDAVYSFGGGMPLPTITPAVKYFLAVREDLKKGKIVMATPDRDKAVVARTLAVDTAEGKVHFATALIEVALSARAEIIFLHTRMRGGAIHVELELSSISGHPEADGIARRFADFIRRQVANRCS